MELPADGDEVCALCHEDVGKGAVPHVPAAAGLCTACHLFSGSGDSTVVGLVAGTAGNTAPLCTGCHADIGERLDQATVHAPAATGDCLGCHVPHASSQASLLVRDGNETCLACHDTVATDLGRRVNHLPVARSCVLCHSPHGSPNGALLLETPNALCLGCHRTRPPSTPAEGAQERFGRRVSPAEQDAISGPVVNLDRLERAGHPVAGHPVSGPKDPAEPARPFTCVSCHAPHGSDTAGLRRFGDGNPTEFCVRCH